MLPSRARRASPHRPGLSAAAAPRAADQGAGSPLSSTTSCAGRLGTLRCSESASSPPRAPSEHPHSWLGGGLRDGGSALSAWPGCSSPDSVFTGSSCTWPPGQGGHEGQAHWQPPQGTAGPSSAFCQSLSHSQLQNSPQDRRTECHGSAPSALPGQTHLRLSRQRALERWGCEKPPSGPRTAGARALSTHSSPSAPLGSSHSRPC